MQHGCPDTLKGPAPLAVSSRSGRQARVMRAAKSDIGPAGRAMERIGRGLLLHPDNELLRSGVREGSIDAEALGDRVRRMVFGLFVVLITDARGMSTPASRWMRRLHRALTQGAARAQCGLWRALQTEMAQPNGGMLVPLSVGDNDAAMNDADLVAACRELMMEGSGDGSRLRDVKAMPALVIGSLYERSLGLHTHIDPDALELEACFSLRWRRNSRRRSQGSFYTPDALVQYVLSQTLNVAIERAVVKARGLVGGAVDSVLDLRVCDPTCGAGHFLVAAARRIAARVDQRAHPNVLRAVIEHCIYGVDLDPLAVDLCRSILWIEAADPAFDPAVLREHIKCGHVLLGAGVRGDAQASPTHARLLADAWCASLVEGTTGSAITLGMLHEIESSPHQVSKPVRESIARIAHSHRFFHWHLEFPEVFGAGRKAGGFDVVVGNPPFLNQLETGTAHTRGAAAIMRERSGGAISRYADSASAFLLLASEVTRSGGLFSLVQPQSLLAAGDVRGVRTAILRQSSLRSLWLANEHVFDAGVFTCAPAFEKAGPRHTMLACFHGGDFQALSPHGIDNEALLECATWSHLMAEAADVPTITIRPVGVIGDVAGATADFRDQYYGLQGCIVEDGDLTPAQRRDRRGFPPLVTTGLIDLAVNHWGVRSTRVHKRLWRAPRIDRRRLERETDLGPWLASRLVPKILLATQTRILEVYVDARGEYVPLVPLITIVPHERSRIWHVAAALASPVCTAIAVRDFGGTAMSADAIKLSARQAAQLPLPGASAAWDQAAGLLREVNEQCGCDAAPIEALRRMAEQLVEASGVPVSDRAAMVSWWSGRHRIARRRHGASVIHHRRVPRESPAYRDRQTGPAAPPR